MKQLIFIIMFACSCFSYEVVFHSDSAYGNCAEATLNCAFPHISGYYYKLKSIDSVVVPESFLKTFKPIHYDTAFTAKGQVLVSANTYRSLIFNFNKSDSSGISYNTYSPMRYDDPTQSDTVIMVVFKVVLDSVHKYYFDRDYKNYTYTTIYAGKLYGHVKWSIAFRTYGPHDYIWPVLVGPPKRDPWETVIYTIHFTYYNFLDTASCIYQKTYHFINIYNGSTRDSVVFHPGPTNIQATQKPATIIKATNITSYNLLGRKSYGKIRSPRTLILSR